MSILSFILIRRARLSALLLRLNALVYILICSDQAWLSIYSFILIKRARQSLSPNSDPRLHLFFFFLSFFFLSTLTPFCPFFLIRLLGLSLRSDQRTPSLAQKSILFDSSFTPICLHECSSVHSVWFRLYLFSFSLISLVLLFTQLVFTYPLVPLLWSRLFDYFFTWPMCFSVLPLWFALPTVHSAYFHLFICSFALIYLIFTVLL